MMRRRPPSTTTGAPLLLALLLAGLTAACAGGRTEALAPVVHGPAEEAGKGAAIRFREDDYAGALAEARRSGRLLFVDFWAPWCHSCLSMQQYVFQDAAMAKISDRYVWLSIDTERQDVNRAVLDRFPVEVWPTLMLIDGTTEAPLLKWGGTATAKELVTLLETTRSEATAQKASPEDGAFARGNRERAAGHLDEAILQYRAALSAAPPKWQGHDRAVEALAGALANKGDAAACVEVARQARGTMSAGASAGVVALAGLGCAERLRPSRPGEGDGSDAEARAFEEWARALATDPHAVMLPDDRSDLFLNVHDRMVRTGRTAEAKRLAGAWVTFLEGEAARAPTKEARAVFDAHRASAYLALGEPSRAVPMLQQSERDFPADYNPPARLATALLAMGRVDEALAAIDRGLARVYGPREARLRATKIEILLAKKDVDSARALYRSTTEKFPSFKTSSSGMKLAKELEGR